MRYEVRYIVDNNEFTEIIDVDNAAVAAETVRQHHPNQGESFELIQVQLIDEESPSEVAIEQNES